MSAAPLFSVIIPTKDRPRLLRRALAFALAQRGVAFEIIVADDGDGAGARAALDGRHPSVTAFVTGFSGQAAARNLAGRRATGRFIACLDDDDWWIDPDHLARLAAALEHGAGLAHASGRIVREDAGNEEIAFAASADPVSIRRDNMLLVSGIGYARQLHETIGPFDESFAVYWDWDFYLRVAAAGLAFAPSGSDGVRISARGGTASSAAQGDIRRAELDRLCARHGLEGIALRNHESIAVDQRDGGSVGKAMGAG